MNKSAPIPDPKQIPKYKSAPVSDIDPPYLNQSDTLGVTLCLAIIFHFIVILGISFASDETPPQKRYDSMEVILVQNESSQAPEDTAILAQRNLEAGDVGEEDLTDGEAEAPFPDERPDLTPPPPMEMAAAELQQAEENQEVMAAENTQEPDLTETNTAQPQEEFQQQDTDTSEEQVAETALEPQPVEIPPLPSAAELISSSFQIAALNAKIRRNMERKARRPKRTFISASTREYKYAAYMEAWRAKVERVGNLNYPEAVRKQRLTGSLILDVALRADGTLEKISIGRSSGHPELDRAAVHIVRLAAPYAPFPGNIASDTDILHITRTWKFLDGRHIQ